MWNAKPTCSASMNQAKNTTIPLLPLPSRTRSPLNVAGDLDINALHMTWLATLLHEAFEDLRKCQIELRRDCISHRMLYFQSNDSTTEINAEVTKSQAKRPLRQPVFVSPQAGDYCSSNGGNYTWWGTVSAASFTLIASVSCLARTRRLSAGWAVQMGDNSVEAQCLIHPA